MKVLLHIALFLLAFSLCAQEETTDQSKRYTGLQSLRLGSVEYKLFNALYTTRKFDGFSELNSRSSYFNAYSQLLIGIKKDFAVGFDLVYHSRIENAFHRNSPFNTLNFSEESNHNINLDTRDSLQHADGFLLETRSVHGISQLGPKVRFKPIKKLKNLAVQQTLFIPLNKDLEPNWVSFTQLFYEHYFTSEWHLFSEVSLWARFGNEFNPSFFAKGFLNYFPGNKWTFYATTTNLYEYGGGLKYLITPNFEVELLSTVFIPLKQLGGNRNSTFNIGFRWSR